MQLKEFHLSEIEWFTCEAVEF